MRVRIGICLFALCWPLLATAAPILTPIAPSHACCRRDGEHHCARPASSDVAFTALCPQSGKSLKFARVKTAKAGTLVQLARSNNARTLVISRVTAPMRGRSIVLASRAPPFA